jgi:hypothetical protein
MVVVLVTITILVTEETTVVEVALVAAMLVGDIVVAIVVVDMVAVGMATMDLVMMEAILEVVKATVIFVITTINLQILNHKGRKFWRQKPWPQSIGRGQYFAKP